MIARVHIISQILEGRTDPHRLLNSQLKWFLGSPSYSSPTPFRSEFTSSASAGARCHSTFEFSMLVS